MPPFINTQSTSGSSITCAEKAAWYHEVLALEPGSKIFFPLARMLADMGRGDEAVSTLQHGLAMHPEFIEARLLLIDILHKSGNAASCGAEVARLAGLFREYPGFWDAWSELSSQSGEAHLSVSLGFLGALFRNSGVTLADVLAVGLKNLHTMGSAPSSLAETPVSPAPRVLDAPPVPPPVFTEVPPFAPEGKEKCSLRTRSMADVLAEQGDLHGAIDIYEELLVAGKPGDRPALQERLNYLTKRLGEEGNTPVHGTPHASASSPAKNLPPKSRSGVLDLLEKLALRLETKARQ